MLSMRAKYGLMAAIRLAREYGRGPLLIAHLAEEEGIPRKFLELILLQLKHRGLVYSKKGKGGGYALRLRPDEVSAGLVLRLLEGSLGMVACVSDAGPCIECKDPVACRIRALMASVHEATMEILDATTLAEMATETARFERGTRSKHESFRPRPRLDNIWPRGRRVQQSRE
jgi:Rrf2 family protein